MYKRNFNYKKSINLSGFTLIELILAIAILGIIITITTNGVLDMIRKNNVNATVARITSLITYGKSYALTSKNDVIICSYNEQDNEVCIENSDWSSGIKVMSGKFKIHRPTPKPTEPEPPTIDPPGKLIIPQPPVPNFKFVSPIETTACGKHEYFPPWKRADSEAIMDLELNISAQQFWQDLATLGFDPSKDTVDSFLKSPSHSHPELVKKINRQYEHIARFPTVKKEYEVKLKKYLQDREKFLNKITKCQQNNGIFNDAKARKGYEDWLSNSPMVA